MKKVLLINTNTELSPYPVPPVGLCLLASRLDGIYDVRVFDGAFEGESNLANIVQSFKPDYIGFSIRNIDDIVADRHIYYVETIIKGFIEPVKKITTVPVILGGSGFSIFPEELMKLTGADYGVVGEGVEILPGLLKKLDQGEDPSGIPNLLISGETSFQRKQEKNSGKGTWNGYSQMFRWIDFTPYRRRSAYSIQTKKGCSHNCVYCTYPVIEGRHYITRSASDVADEICEATEKLGDVTFEFVDSTFNDPEDHAEKICREIIRRKLRVRLRTMGINPMHTSEQLFELMIAAGFSQIDATPDTASETMLKNMGKGFGIMEVRKMAKLIRKFELPTMWFFLFGGPGENEETFAETLGFIDEFVNTDDLVYMTSGLRVYPGTPLYSQSLKDQRFSKNESLLFPSYFYYSDMLGKERLNQLIREAESRRPNCIPALETHPPEAMIAEAVERRKMMNLEEPMFRSLLRIRKEWMSKGML